MPGAAAGKCSSPPAPNRGWLGHGLQPVALAVLTNPIRPEAPDTFRYFCQARGRYQGHPRRHNPATVSAVAIQAGIQGERFVDAAALKEPGDYARAIEEFTVFGRVTQIKSVSWCKPCKGRDTPWP